MTFSNVIDLNGCSNLKWLKNGVTNGNITTYYTHGCNLTGVVDLSMMNGLGGDVRFANAGVGQALLTGIINPISSVVFTNYYAFSCNLIGNLSDICLTENCN